MLRVGLPKFVSETMPHSSLASTLTRSQSGTKLPRRGSPTGKKLSFHDRVTNSARLDTGSSAPFMNPTCVPSACMYLFTPILSAVFCVPNRSIVAPSLGAMSLNDSIWVSGNVMSRVGTSVAGPRCVSGA